MLIMSIHSSKLQILIRTRRLKLKETVISCVNLVCLHVFLHVGLLGKSSATDDALKWFLSCVAVKGKQI